MSGVRRLPSRFWSTMNIPITHSPLLGLSIVASRAAGTMLMSGPKFGMKLNSAASAPSTPASGTPSIRSPSHVAKPITIIETACPMSHHLRV
jgi:hypothetical protein